LPKMWAPMKEQLPAAESPGPDRKPLDKAFCYKSSFHGWGMISEKFFRSAITYSLNWNPEKMARKRVLS